MKKKVFKYCVKSGKNIIVPETGASPLPGVPGKVKSMLKLLKKHDYRVVMTAVSGSRERCRLNGTSREVKEGKKYNGMTWKWASDKVSKCFNYARSIGYTKETFFITDNTDWDDVRTTMVPPHYGINVTYVNVTKPDFNVEGDTKPVYTPQQLPDIPFASMKQIARAQFTVCAGLEKEAAGADDQQFLTMNVQLLNYGRSVWLVWDKNKLEDDKGDDEENYICLNEQRRILGADDPTWKSCLSEDRELGNADENAPTKNQRFWCDMWSMPGGEKIAERMIVVLEKENETDTNNTAKSLAASRVTSFRRVGQYFGSMASMVSTPTMTTTTTTNETTSKSTGKKGPPPLPPPKTKRTPPKITQRPRAKTPARPPGVVEKRAPSMRKSADLCDRKKLFEQFDLDGDGKLTHSELEKALRACLPSVTSDEVNLAMRTLDADNDGIVTIDEFMSAVVNDTSRKRFESDYSYTAVSTDDEETSSSSSEEDNEDVEKEENRTQERRRKSVVKVLKKRQTDNGMRVNQLRMVLNLKDKTLRDDWLKKLELSLVAVNGRTPRLIAKRVNEYLRSKSDQKNRITYLNVRRYVLKYFDELVVDINETVIEQIMKNFLSL